MQLLVTGLVDATTRVSIFATAGSLVWSPAAGKFVASAPDAVLVPVQCLQPGLGNIGTVSIPGLAQPAGVNDLKLIYLDKTGAPIGQPWPIFPPAAPSPTVVVLSGQVVNLGG